jgi:hypothetical protein
MARPSVFLHCFGDYYSAKPTSRVVSTLKAILAQGAFPMPLVTHHGGFSRIKWLTNRFFRAYVHMGRESTFYYSNVRLFYLNHHKCGFK